MSASGDFDVIVIGAGHNGLAATALLAARGLRVLCLEKNAYVGGMAGTREILTGCRNDVGASLLFPLAKATELVTGIALLSDLFVPLALVLAMPVTVSVFVVDALHPHPHLRALLMGSGALIMNLFLLGAYFDHFRPMLATRGRPRLDLRTTGTATPGPAVEAFAALLRALMPLLGAISVLLGMAMVIWLSVMIAQYIGHPAPLSAIHALQPR